MSRRRKIQLKYNKKHNIKPRGIKRAQQESLHDAQEAQNIVKNVIQTGGEDFELVEYIRELNRQMQQYADKLDFEKAAELRDEILRITGAESKKKKSKKDKATK